MTAAMVMQGRGPEPLDLSSACARLCQDLCRRLPELAHVDNGCLLFCLSRSRTAGLAGVYARIAPLRFADGQGSCSRRRGRYRETYCMPPLHHQGREILYLIYLLVPRFLRLSFAQKLSTIIHELYHISPACDGDIRRLPGRNFAHGSSRRRFNERIEGLATAYLASGPDQQLLAFLHTEEADWQSGKVRLTGLNVPLPRPRLTARERL
jgi:hypothetical protein